MGDRWGVVVVVVVEGGGGRGFVERDDATRHVVRGQPGIAEYDGDDRYVDVREDVDWRPKGSAKPGEQDQHCHDDKSVGAPKRDPDDPDHMHWLLRYTPPIREARRQMTAYRRDLGRTA